MGNSLLDQLKKSGLVDEKKANQARKEKQKQARQQKGKKARPLDEARRRAEQTHAEKVERDRELNLQRKQAAEQKAIAAQIRQLIELNRIEDDEGEIAFNFTDGTQVRRLYVSGKTRDQLVRGSLAIVKLDGRYDRVPAGVAEKIAQRDPACVVLCNVAGPDARDDDDPYADFQVPDDLMW